MNNARPGLGGPGGLGGAVLAAAALALIFTASLFDGLVHSVPRSGFVHAFGEAFSTAGNGLTLVAVCLAVYLAGRFGKNRELRASGTLGFYAILIGSAAVHIMKAAFERPRPSHATDSILHFLHDPQLFDLTGRYNSFPSGHSVASFAVAAVFARRFPRYAPAFYSLAALVGLARIALGSHYPSDVAGGAVLGLAVGWLLTGGADRGPAPLKRWLVAGLVFAAVFISFFKTGGFFVFDVDEAVFSEASREMVVSGDFITPTYNFEPRYDKPILIYWFMSAAFALMGFTEFAARFTSSSFGALLVVMTFFFVRRATGGRELPAFMAALALLLNLEFFVYSHSAVTDMTLNFFIAASLYSFYLAVAENDRRWFAAAWGASALAMLTKGVIGLLFPSMVGLLYLLATGNLARLKDALRPAYIALFFVITVPWFVAEYSVNGWEFIDEFIIKHHIKRYSGVISSHSGPVYFYILVILAGFFPWVGFVLTSLRKGAGEIIGRTGGLYAFTTIWFLFILVFFSAAKTKLPNYIFPLYPALAVMTGLAAASIMGEPERKKKPGLFIITLLSLMLGSALLLIPYHGVEFDVEVPRSFFYIGGGIFLLAAASALAAYSKPKEGILALAAVTAALLVFLRLEAVPVASRFLQEDLYRYSVYAREAGDDAVLATYEINRPSIPFYARRGFEKIERADRDRLRTLATEGPVVVITSPGMFSEIDGVPGIYVLHTSREFLLAAVGDDLPPFDPAEGP